MFQNPNQFETWLLPLDRPTGPFVHIVVGSICCEDSESTASSVPSELKIRKLPVGIILLVELCERRPGDGLSHGS